MFDRFALQQTLNLAHQVAAWLGLKFKPAKCASLHIVGKNAIPTSFSIDGQEIITLGGGQAYTHLGVPTGLRVDQTPRERIAKLEREVQLIFASVLAPWQKLHAVRTFTIPQIDFALRTAKVQKSLQALRPAAPDQG